MRNGGGNDSEGGSDEEGEFGEHREECKGCETTRVVLVLNDEEICSADFGWICRLFIYVDGEVRKKIS